MSEQSIQQHADAPDDDVLMGASSSEILGGGAAVVLSILGLVHIDPITMAAVSAIALGAAFALNGGLLAAVRSRVMARAQPSTLEVVEFAGGVSVEAVTGIAAVVLGILTLLNVDAVALLPVAALVLGVGIIFSSGALARLNAAARSQKPTVERVTYSAVAFATAFHVLVGIGAGVLAILALIGYAPLVLSLVAFLGLGAASMLSGATMTGRLLGASHSHAA